MGNNNSSSAAKGGTDIPTDGGEHALIVAAEAGNTAVCKLLYEKEPKLTALRNRMRQSAYDIAVSKKHQEVVRIIDPPEYEKLIAKTDEDQFHDKYFVTDEEELERHAKELFQRHDHDHSADLTQRELCEVLLKLGLDPTPAQAEEKVKQYDRDGNKKIDLDEFYEVFSALDRVLEQQGITPNLIPDRTSQTL